MAYFGIALPKNGRRVSVVVLSNRMLVYRVDQASDVGNGSSINGI